MEGIKETEVKNKIPLIKRKNFYLFIIFFIGFVLRVIGALNLGVSADDMHFAPHAINFLGSGKLQTWDQAPLWFMFTDISYRIFGTTQFGSRFAAVLFGSLSILVVFLLSKEMFKSERAALISSSFAAFSPFLIKNTTAEMDVMLMFFVLLFMLLFLIGLRKKKDPLIVLAMICLGLGALTKHYALLFLPPMWVYYYFRRKKEISQIKILKNIFLFGVIFTITLSPMLISNYLTYSSKGILDFQFTRLLHIGADKSSQYYGWAAGFEGGIDLKGFFFGNSVNWSTPEPTAIIPIMSFFTADPLTFIFGLLGLIYLFKINKEKLFLISSIFIVPWVILGSVNLLDKHFIFEQLLFSIPAGVFLEKLGTKTKLKISYLILIILLLNLVVLGHPHSTSNNFYNPSSENQLIKFKNEKIDKNSLVIVDTRIYRGRMAYTFNDRHYIETSQFLEILSGSKNLPGEPVLIKTYLVECVVDDCGWGTIKNQPELNQSIENFIKAYSEGISYKGEILVSPNTFNILGIGRSNPEPYYRIYERNLQISPSIINYADSTHNIFLYPIGYDRRFGEIFDDYDLNPPASLIIYTLGKYVLWLDLIFVFIIIILLFYYVIKSYEQ